MQTLSPPTPRRICPYWAECNTRDMQSGPLGPQPGSESLAVITSAPGRGGCALVLGNSRQGG